jgi:hypothetical protein
MVLIFIVESKHSAAQQAVLKPFITRAVKQKACQLPSCIFLKWRRQESLTNEYLNI